MKRLIRQTSQFLHLVKCLRQTRVLHTSVYLCPSKSVHTMAYSAFERGQPNTQDYRVYFRGASGNVVSPFHDIPLYADPKTKTCNMIVEIPRWTNAKMEISKDDKMNPIKQDVKKGKLRYVKNIFPHHGYIWNYGALPQTWEDPKHKDQLTGTNGDNDPIDVCEIGHKVHKRGAVIEVKVLGSMLLIDEGETDWKIIAIDVTDPLAQKLNDIGDVEKEMPGFLKATYEWFRYYKVPDGKPENTVYNDGKCQSRDEALAVIDLTNKQWEGLMKDPASGKGVSCTCTTVNQCKAVISPEAAQSLLDDMSSMMTPAPVDSQVDLWHFVIPQ